MKGKEGGMETVQEGRCEGKGGDAWRQCRWEGVKGRRRRMETVQDSDMCTYVDLICSDLNLC